MVEIVNLLLEKVFSLGVKKSLFSILIGLLVMFYVISTEIITSLILSILLAVITYITCVLILSFVDGLFISYKYSLEKKRTAKEEEVKRIISFLQSLSPIEENRLEQFMKNNNRLKLRTPETLMRQGFIRFSDIRHHHIMHTVSGTFPIDPAVLPRTDRAAG